MAKAKTKSKKGTKALCGALKEIRDMNKEIADDKNASKKDRKESKYVAGEATKDGKAWGCGWAS
jgi:hypothetical protein